MAGMHPVTLRLYQAVQMLTRARGLPDPSQVARELNVSPQVLTNWHARGPSDKGLLDFQLSHGVNASWLRTGQGPLMVGGSTRSMAGEQPATYASSPLSAEVLEALARRPLEDRRRIENGLRGQLDLPPLALSGNRNAA